MDLKTTVSTDSFPYQTFITNAKIAVFLMHKQT